MVKTGRPLKKKPPANRPNHKANGQFAKGNNIKSPIYIKKVCPLCRSEKTMTKRQEYCNERKLVKCTTCEKETSVSPGRIKNQKRKGYKIYCSHPCQLKGLDVGAKVIRRCKYCSKDYKVYRSQIKHRGSNFCSIPCMNEYASKYRRGENSPTWKGGKSRGYKTGYWSREYKLWRESVFKRDNWRCQWCAVRSGVELQADHIFSFTHYPKKRFSLKNGRTLCIKCHIKRTVKQIKILQNKHKKHN